MFGIDKICNSNVWRSHISDVWKRKSPEFQGLEKPIIKNSNVWKSQTSQFQCLEKPKLENRTIAR